MLKGNTNVCNAIYKSVKFAYKALLNTETCYNYRINNKFLEILQNHWNKTHKINMILNEDTFSWGSDILNQYKRVKKNQTKILFH